MSKVDDLIDQLTNLKVANAVMKTIIMIHAGVRDEVIFKRMENLNPDEDAYAVVSAMKDAAIKGDKDNG